MSLLTVLVMLALDSGAKPPDAGTRLPPTAVAGRAAAPRPEDQEVIDNLELLENMDESADLELLQELSVER